MNHHAALTIEQNWNPSIPPVDLKGSKLQLLTIGGVCVHGIWNGQLGQHYVAWCPLLKLTSELKTITSQLRANYVNAQAAIKAAKIAALH